MRVWMVIRKIRVIFVKGMSLATNRLPRKITHPCQVQKYRHGLTELLGHVDKTHTERDPET